MCGMLVQEDNMGPIAEAVVKKDEDDVDAGKVGVQPGCESSSDFLLRMLEGTVLQPEPF